MLTKEYEQFNFKFHGSYDVSEIKEILLSYKDEWNYDTTRQEMFNGTHVNTHSYFIIEQSLHWIPGDRYKIINRSADKKLNELVEPIIKNLEIIHGGRRGRVLFTKLKEEGNIRPHKDGGDYLGIVRRNHIAISTNDYVKFNVDGESINMKEGDCWEINNNKIHSVTNDAKLERIHLIVDIMPENYIIL